MKKLQIISVFAAACVLAFSGCSSRGTYVNADKSGVIGTGIDIQDFNNASAALVNDLLSSGALDNLGLKMPIKMLVSRVKCDVGEPINRDLLTNRICMALNNSGKVVAVKDDPQTVAGCCDGAADAGQSAPAHDQIRIKSDFPEVTLLLKSSRNHRL